MADGEDIAVNNVTTIGVMTSPVEPDAPVPAVEVRLASIGTEAPPAEPIATEAFAQEGAESLLLVSGATVRQQATNVGSSIQEKQACEFSVEPSIKIIINQVFFFWPLAILWSDTEILTQHQWSLQSSLGGSSTELCTSVDPIPEGTVVIPAPSKVLPGNRLHASLLATARLLCAYELFLICLPQRFAATNQATITKVRSMLNYADLGLGNYTGGEMSEGQKQLCWAKFGTFAWYGLSLFFSLHTQKETALVRVYYISCRFCGMPFG